LTIKNNVKRKNEWIIIIKKVVKRKFLKPKIIFGKSENSTNNAKYCGVRPKCTGSSLVYLIYTKNGYTKSYAHYPQSYQQWPNPLEHRVLHKKWKNMCGH